ncbi:MAG: hypothetical protein ISS79_08985 [Phycisphaerae bacterium]|nr:hypothetical protein [Phycisphaerae bacterium]
MANRERRIGALVVLFGGAMLGGCGNTFDSRSQMEWFDLAGLVDLDEHTVDAAWSQRGDGYVFSAGKPRAYISLPYDLAGSYELLTRLTIERSKETVRLLLPVADRYIQFDIKGDTGNTAAETATMMLSGLTPERLTWSDDKIAIGEEYRYHFDIHVREPKCRIRIMVNDCLLYSWLGNLSDVNDGIRPERLRQSWIELETAYYTTAYFAELAAMLK